MDSMSLVVDVIPTKTSGSRASRKGGQHHSGLPHGIHSQVDCDTGWFMFQAVVGFFGAFRMSTLGRKNCEYAVAKSGYSCQSGIACVLVNLMTGKDRSRGASSVLCTFYRSCSTMRQLL